MTVLNGSHTEVNKGRNFARAIRPDPAVYLHVCYPRPTEARLAFI